MHTVDTTNSTTTNNSIASGWIDPIDALLQHLEGTPPDPARDAPARTIRGTVKAWLTNYADALDDDPARAVALLGYSNNQNMVKYGWTPIGEAEITVTLLPGAGMNQRVQALRVELQAVRDAALAKASAIEGRIQELLEGTA